jgi:hypothetical protein
MAAQDTKETVSADREATETAGFSIAWAGWLALFGVIGILATIGIQRLVKNWCEREEFRQSRIWMQDQMGQLRRGEINCLVNPDPRFIEELLIDTACAAKVRDLYVGSDLSDPRLGRLRELPNLKCIVFLFADQQSAFVERLHGMSTIEELTFDHTLLTRNDVEQIASFPRLKSLHLERLSRFADLDGLRNHPSLERLSLAAAAADKSMIPLFQNMPRLRELGVGVSHKEKESKADDSFEKLLAEALPGCKCCVWEDDR